MTDEDVVDGIYVGGGIDGRALGAPGDGLGSFYDGRPATEANVRAARKFFLELPAKDVSPLPDGGLVDTGSGQIYDRIEHDPLFSNTPTSDADVFALFGDGVVSFLKRRGVTIDEIERARADSEQRASDEAERLRKVRARAKQVPLRLDLVRGDETPTLRRAAERIHELGGEIKPDSYDGIVVTLPATLTLGDGFGSPLLERELRIEGARCAQVLSYASSLVRAALESKQPLLETLPDEVPAI
jgi:hypothetical protein